MKHQWQLTPSSDEFRMVKWRCRLCGAYNPSDLTPLGSQRGALMAKGSFVPGLTCDEARELRPAWEVLES